MTRVRKRTRIQAADWMHKRSRSQAAYVLTHQAIIGLLKGQPLRYDVRAAQNNHIDYHVSHLVTLLKDAPCGCVACNQRIGIADDKKSTFHEFLFD